ncbi:response regulator transcription factor [Sulfurospirillum sp. 1307]
MEYRVLVLEDNELLLETYEDFLSLKGCDTVLVDSAQKAMEVVYRQKFDIYLLDVKLPNSSGFEFLKSLRDSGDLTPAIFITSYEQQEKLKEGFRLGADDYIKKPFDLEELWLRIEAILSRVKGYKQDKIKIDEDFYLDIKRKNLMRSGEEVLINLKDFKLLELLLENRGKVVTKEMIENRLWSPNEVPTGGAIRVYINNLKKIFGKEQITNIRGIGYRFEK